MLEVWVHLPNGYLLSVCLPVMLSQLVKSEFTTTDFLFTKSSNIGTQLETKAYVRVIYCTALMSLDSKINDHYF